MKTWHAVAFLINRFQQKPSVRSECVILGSHPNERSDVIEP